MMWLLLFVSVPVPVGSNGVSLSVGVPRRVNGTVGTSVVLPCKFSSPYTQYTTFEITVTWKVKVFYIGPVLFSSTNRAKLDGEFENVVNTNVDNRYRLAGDPRRNNVSLEVKNATLDDNSQYFCRVEVKRQGLSPYMEETNPGITLKITGPPTILNMSIHAINETQFTLVCIVKGEPTPNIVWIDSRNNSLPVNGSDTPVTPGPGKYQIVGELHGPKLGGNYTCMATNNRGSVTQVIYFTGFGKDQTLLKVIICASAGSLILIILIVIALVIWKRNRGKATFTPATKSYQMDSLDYSEVKLCQQQSIPEALCAVPGSSEVTKDN
ncbi:sialic acid-binding Ig-like lectin 15 [Carcharodon carcharias]|uniref:sialic acid-binding Ig-like lectin 15 n=1 Tax=Carcharodon carcharias TaxID=13397 RepID=UPI001B7F00A8|nr:sialic acid-binding Ig-like lectin 15 [Carcharodon carcharias]